MKRSIDEIKKRHGEIIEILSNNPDASIKELSKRLKISELTVRRDLEKLQQNGFLQRIRGGAIIKQNKGEVITVSYENKDGKNLSQKQLIAKKAIEFVNEGDTVFINAGTTSLEVIRLLKDKKVTILTNNAMAISVFTNGSKASLILTGGEFNEKNMSYFGQMASATINMMYASICILGINGITANEGLTTAYYPETMVNMEFMKRCRGKVIVIADGSKVGKTYSFETASSSDIDYLVTDSTANTAQLNSIRSKGVEVIIA